MSLHKRPAETGRCWGFPPAPRAGDSPAVTTAQYREGAGQVCLSVNSRFQPLRDRNIQCTPVKPPRIVLHGTHAVFARSIFMYRCSAHPTATCVGLILMFVWPHIRRSSFRIEKWWGLPLPFSMGDSPTIQGREAVGTNLYLQFVQPDLSAYTLFGGGCVGASLTYPLGVSPAARAVLRFPCRTCMNRHDASHSSSRIFSPDTVAGDSGPPTRLLGWSHEPPQKAGGACWPAS